MNGMALSRENGEQTKEAEARRYRAAFSRSPSRYAFLVNWALQRAHVTTVSIKRPLAGNDLVEDTAERKQVAARVSILALQLLGRHVLQRAQNLPLMSQCLGDRGVVLQHAGPLATTEVEQLNPLFGDQDIRGLQIAMRDAVSMRRIECSQNLACILHGLRVCSDLLRATHASKMLATEK
jgi:hypothetical protein